MDTKIMFTEPDRHPLFEPPQSGPFPTSYRPAYGKETFSNNVYHIRPPLLVIPLPLAFSLFDILPFSPTVR